MCYFPLLVSVVIYHFFSGDVCANGGLGRWKLPLLRTVGVSALCPLFWKGLHLKASQQKRVPFFPMATGSFALLVPDKALAVARRVGAQTKLMQALCLDGLRAS